MTTALTHADLEGFLAVEKEIVVTSGWAAAIRGDWIRFRSALIVDGSTSDKISFVAQCAVERPDEQVALSLLVEWKGKPRPFARVDWNGALHGNGLPVCGEWRFKSAGRNHFHDPSLHGAIDIEELFGAGWNLPIARPLPKIPRTFPNLLEEASQLLHIVNLNEIPEPPWAPRTPFL